MKLAIAGMGPAGAYLGASMNGRADIEIYEMQTEKNFSSICAWGTGSGGIVDLTRKVGLNFDEYILYKSKHTYIEIGKKLLKAKSDGLATFDKPRLLKDITKGINVHYNTRVFPGYLESRSSIAIDATGVYRRLLPQLKQDLLLPTIQYKVRFSEMPYDDFFVSIFKNYGGYLWFFPLGGNTAFVGGGDMFNTHEPEVMNFIKKFQGEILPNSRKGKAIRLLPPSMATPHYYMNTIGVGESVGAVFPLVGEGILPSMLTADILMRTDFDRYSYSSSLKKTFKAYEDAYKFILHKSKHVYGLIDTVIFSLGLFRYIRLNSKYIGVKAGFKELYELFKPL